MNIRLEEGGFVLGVGTDLVDVERIRASHQRHGERFLDRVFTAVEQAYCLDHRNPYPHLAARFAAKEALSKAFSTGIGAEFAFTSLSVEHGERSQPLARLDAKGQALLEAVGGTNVLLSLTHTSTLAQAFVLIVRRPG
ncbi:holo-ACP synthase [Ruficoccus amylovorans]|uniref:Holo-[acyl-carrier-protein] synthase n=1 Tax=Ruficoccus amylovorans TaxID=1804625 RepID=A0A842HBQ4_9BACT|nr:holo-ACP synthase [Ruficoccus amylovorans]MBC2593136.1 holo-ACP synthase [Ruficoccus amylovorans]